MSVSPGRSLACACCMTDELTGAAGTNPIHNKKPKKAAKDEDEDDIAYKKKQQAGRCIYTFIHRTPLADIPSDKKARDEMATLAKGKGPLNAGQQGIKKSGKKGV